jgi:hypothetical protein
MVEQTGDGSASTLEQLLPPGLISGMEELSQQYQLNNLFRTS